MSRLSVVLPAYNEEQILAKTCRTLKEILSFSEIEYELVFVDDGSSDKTWNVIEKVSKEDRNISGIHFSRNFGKEAAIIAGLAAMEVEGVSSMAGNATRELIAKLGMKSLSKGVKVDVLDGIVTVTLALNMSYGYSIKDITAKVQEKVKAAIENMTGLEVADVNIRVAGVDVPEEA